MDSSDIDISNIQISIQQINHGAHVCGSGKRA